MKVRVVFVVILAALVAFSLIPFATSGQKSEDATDIRRGLMTERQRAHSKLYTARRQNGRKLTDLKDDEAQGEVTVTTGQEFGSSDDDSQFTFDKYVAANTCEADVVVLARAVAKESQLTPDETYVFTDYTFEIQKLLKNDSMAPLPALGTIVVSRGGGRVKLDGRIITLIDTSYRPISIGGVCLLFLDRIPETGAYRTSASSAMVTSDGLLTTLADPHRARFNDTRSQRVEALIQNTLESGKCSEKRIQ